MLPILKTLWSIFTPQQRQRIKVLQLLILVLSVFEIITIGSVAAFMHIIGNLQTSIELPIMNDIYQYFGQSDEKFLAFCSIILIITLSTSALFSVLGTKKINSTSLDIGRDISVKLFQYYQSKNWLYHTQVNSSWIINRVLVEAPRLTVGVLSPFLLMLSRLVLVLLIIVTLVVYDPVITVSGAVLFVGGYMLVFRIARPRLSRNSILISKANQQRVRTLNEGFEGIKNVLLLNKQEHFTAQFDQSAKQVMSTQASNMTLAAAPRYVMEWMAYVGMAILVLYFIVVQQKNISQIIPVLTLYGISAFKLLPSLQQVYAYIANIRGNYSVVGELAEDIRLSSQVRVDVQSGNNVNFKKSIELKNINFGYPGKENKAIKDISLEIYKNQCVGFVGPSGSGKSTLIDILSGLIDIDEGDFKVDENNVKNNLVGWRSNIAYVPQSIVLTDSSIAENIAFGCKKEDIDFEQVQKVIKLAHLDELMDKLDNGIHTQVGERGVQLSGGQRQRIGIARALYNDANVLIFDEATSALDGITEKLIMDAIHELSGQKTIILIAHRLKTVQACDHIYFIKDGELVDQGNYYELLEKNADFKKMALHA